MPTVTAEPWWRSRAVLIGALVAAVLGLVGVAVGVLALTGSSSTRTEVDETQAAADEALAEADDIEADQAEAQAQVEDLAATSSAVVDAAEAFDQASNDAVVAYNAFNEAMTAAIAEINAGNVQGGQNQIRNAGATTSAAFADAVNAELAALSDLQSAVSDFQEVVGDA
jgi:hypothetical protein